MRRLSPLIFVAALAWAAVASATDKVYHFRLIDNLVVIPVIVNGRVGSGVLDTGTNALVIDESFARRVGVTKGKALGDGGGSGTHKIASWQAILQQFTAPSFRANRVKARIIDTGFYTTSAGFPVDVIIGTAFFEHRVVSIDYARRTLTVTPGPGARLRCRAPIPFRLLEGAPVIHTRASFDAGQKLQSLRLMVDLGTRHQAMLLDGHFLATPAGIRLRHSGPPIVLSTGAGGPISGWPATASALLVGSQRYTRVAFAASTQLGQSPFDGFLGAPFWKTGVIAFDYDHRRLCLPGEPTGIIR